MTRSRRNAVMGLAVAAIVALPLAGCLSAPASTVARLASFDPMTMDPAAIRAAVRAPDSVRIRAETARLQMTVTLPGGEPESRAFTLASATDAADLSELAAEARKDFFIEVYRLPPEEAKSLADWRRELAGRSKGGGNLVLTVSADACRLSGRPRDPVPITTYFAGKPGGGFTMLTRETDFVALAARMGRAAEIEACP